MGMRAGWIKQQWRVTCNPKGDPPVSHLGIRQGFKTLRGYSEALFFWGNSKSRDQNWMFSNTFFSVALLELHRCSENPSREQTFRQKSPMLWQTACRNGSVCGHSILPWRLLSEFLRWKVLGPQSGGGCQAIFSSDSEEHCLFSNISNFLNFITVYILISNHLRVFYHSPRLLFIQLNNFFPTVILFVLNYIVSKDKGFNQKLGTVEG